MAGLDERFAFEEPTETQVAEYERLRDDFYTRDAEASARMLSVALVASGLALLGLAFLLRGLGVI